MLVVVNRDPRHTILLSLLLILSLSTGYTMRAQDGGTPASAQGRADDRVVVLTFDDAVKSHRTFVAPLLKELGFGATFFVTHRWMADSSNFMTWEEIAEIHRLGFEIGNHSWTHGNFSSPKEAARLPAELALVESELQKVKVPKPTSFAYSGNSFGPEAVEQLKALGYTLARRGMQPEIPYGKIEAGPLYDPQKHHPLLIPTSGDSYPGWTLEHFQKVVDQASPGKIVGAAIPRRSRSQPSLGQHASGVVSGRDELSEEPGLPSHRVAGRRPISAEDSTGRSIADIPAVEPAGAAAPSAG